MDLKTYLSKLSAEDKRDYADRCNTSPAYLYQVSVGLRQASESLAISLDKESGGVVRCEDVRPDVDWDYLSRRPDVIGEAIANA